MARLKRDPVIEVYCDGSCLKPGEHGAWAYLIRYPDRAGEETGWKATPATTNNRMEMAAVIRALDHLLSYDLAHARIVVYCDSQYVVKGVREWLPGWKQRGWRKSDGKPVKNEKLWKKLDSRLAKFARLGFRWVRGHDGNEGNEIVDKMCHRAAKELRDNG